MLKDFVTSNLPNVEVKDEHKVLFISIVIIYLEDWLEGKNRLKTPR